MGIYLVQHGVALEKELNEDRPLTEFGRRAVESVSINMRKAGVTVDKVYHSGKLRAQQTAQSFANQIGDGSVTEIDGIDPNDDFKAFSGSMEDGVMYVGHLPFMDKLVSYLVTQDENADVVKFENGAVVCLEKGENGSYYVDWMLKPALCNL